MLILLYEREGQLLIPLTRRTESLHSHRGQVSLPGGARESNDESLASTAVRELCEELGLSPHTVEVIGALTPLWVPSSSFCVYPFVGYAAEVPTFKPHAEEVADVIEAPLQVLLDPATRHVETRVQNDREFQVPLYRIGPEQVWGATAMMLGEFVALLQAAQQIEQVP